MRFVLDCSIVVSWCLEDENNSYSSDILGMFSTSDIVEAIVPSIWPIELANVLLVSERRNRISKADSNRFLKLLADMPIIIDDISSAEVLHDILSLGRELNLSSYDATYLELAIRMGLPIATLDKRLQQAATDFGVALVSE